MTTDTDALQKRLLVAHENENAHDLVDLYTLVANQNEAAGNIDAACFYLTHAFVYALQEGAPEANPLNERLFLYGRDVRLAF